MPGPRLTALVLLLVCVLALAAFLLWRGEGTPSEGAGGPGAGSPRGEARLDGSASPPGTDGSSYEPDALGTAASDEPTGTLRVTVSDADADRPVEGVKVTVRLADGSRREATTDTAGEVVFDRAVPGAALVWAASTGARRAVEDCTVEAEGESEVELELEDAVRLVGRVVDARTGRGIEGAVVGVAEHQGDWWRGLLDPGAAIADGSGRFEGWWVCPFDRFWYEGQVVTALAAGYALGLEPFEYPRDDTGTVHLEIRLEPGGVVTGSVVRPDGSAARGAEVICLPQIEEWVPPPLPDDALGFVDDERLYVATTDEHGRYEVRGLPLGGTFSAVARTAGFRRSRAARDLRPTSARPTLLADLALRRAAGVLVRVLDPDGDPVMDADVQWVDDPDAGNRNTDEEGRLDAWILDPGPHVVRVEADGHPPVSRRVVLAAGEHTEVVVRLEPGADIAGVLVDPGGEPVPSGQVAAWALGSGLRGEAWTDEEGRFRIDTLAPGPYRLRSRYAELEHPGPVVTAPAEGVRLVLPPRGWLRARLVVPADDDLPREIAIRYHEDDIPQVRTVRGSPTGGGDSIYLCDLPAGRRTFRFVCPGYAPVLLDLDVPAGERALDLEVPLGPGLALEGRVVDANGRPVADAWVSVQDQQGADGRTDAEGRFRIPRLAAEPVRLHVDAVGFVHVRVEHRVGPETPSPTILLPRGGVLRGRVVDEGGDGVEGASVCVRSADDPEDADRWFTAVTGELGGFRTRIPAGTWWVGLDDAYDFVPRASVTLATGGDVEVELLAPDG